MAELDLITSLSNNMSNKNQTEIQKAWDLAKEQAKEKYPDSDPSYYPYVVSLTKQLMNQNTQDIKQQMNPNAQKPSMFRNPGPESNYIPKQDTPNLNPGLTEEIKELEYFDWKAKSTPLLASVRFLINDAVYQMDFTYAKENSPQWNYEWNTLCKQGIDKILSVSIDQLNGDPDGLRISASKTPLYNKDKLFKVMNLAFKEYFEKFTKKNQIQYILFTVESVQRLKFLLEFVVEFNKKNPAFKEVKEVSNLLKKSMKYYIAIKNNDVKLKEDGEGGGDAGGTVTSGSFGDAIPSDAGRSRKDWKKDWEDQSPKKEIKTKVILKRFVDLSLID